MLLDRAEERVAVRALQDAVAVVPVRKLSVALDDEVAAQVARAAKRAGVRVSAWLNHAAENELAIEAGFGAVRESEADHGMLTAEELAAADVLLDRVLESARRAS